MRKVSNVLDGKGSRNSQFTAEMAHSGSKPDRTPASRRDHIIDKERVSKEKLEEVYRAVPIVFNSINKWTQLIVERNWSIEGENADRMMNFLDDVGHTAGELHWEDMRESIYRYLAIYGEAFVEIIPNEDETEIVDLVLIDPKTMEYARSDKGQVALDDYGNPIGYSQGIPEITYHADNVEQVYDVPEEVKLYKGEVFIPAKYVAHYKMYTYGEGLFPIGLIEPIYPSAERSVQLRRDYGDKAHSTLFPTRVASVGDDMHPPTPEMVDEYLEQMTQAKADTELSVPHYVDIEMLEANNPTGMIEFFKQYDRDIITGMGIPESFATGQGGNVNRATLAIQDKLAQISMKDIIKRTERTTEREIFSRVADMNGWDGYPQINVDTSVKVSEKLSDEIPFEQMESQVQQRNEFVEERLGDDE